MSVSTNDILDTISKMTVLEVVDLIKAMEDKFGVSAAAATVAVAAPAVGAAAAAEEQTEFIVISSMDPKMVHGLLRIEQNSENTSAVAFRRRKTTATHSTASCSSYTILPIRNTSRKCRSNC